MKILEKRLRKFGKFVEESKKKGVKVGKFGNILWLIYFLAPTGVCNVKVKYGPRCTFYHVVP